MIALSDQTAFGDSLVRLDEETTPATTWRAIATSDRFQRSLVTAVRDLLAGHAHTDRARILRKTGVEAAHGGLASVLIALDRPPENDRHEAALETVARAGQPEPSLLGHLDLEPVVASLAALFEAASTTPTIAVELTTTFRELDAEYRRETLNILTTLATGADVRIAASTLTQRWLRHAHREELPVSELPGTHQDSDPEALADAAADELNPDGRPVQVLEALYEEPSHTLSRNGLYGSFAELDESRVRQVLAELRELGLVDSFRRGTDYYDELTAAGEGYLDALHDSIGRQVDLTSGVSEPGHSSDHSRVARAGSGEEEDAPAETSAAGAGLVSTSYLSRPEEAATLGSAAAVDVTLVNHPVESLEDPRSPRWTYEPSGDRLVVGAEAQNPMQLHLALTFALTSGLTFEKVLNADRLEGDDGGLSGLEPEDLTILRDCRCLGYLKNADADGEAYIEALQEAAADLRDLTRRLHHGEYEDEDEFRGVVLREALGLESTMIHLLDLAGVEVVREIRFPEFTRNYDDKRRSGLAETVARAISIQSVYGEFTAYRQLYESRERKREAAMRPAVDANDPFGEPIGAWVLVGPRIKQFEVDLVDAFNQLELHEDAPEFDIPVSIDEPDRAAYAVTTRYMAKEKNLDITREAVSALQAFTGSPFDAADAINRLAGEELRRRIRLDEIRHALAQIEPDRIVPDAPPTVRKILSALLVADRRLSPAELAERADVSTRSVRRHKDRLKALTLVDQNDDGLRLNLPFHTEEERRDRILPGFATDRLLQFGTVLQRLRTLTHGFDADDPVFEALKPPADVATVYHEWPIAEVWVGVLDPLGILPYDDERDPAARIADTAGPPRIPEYRGGEHATEVLIGPTLHQASIECVG